MFSWQAASAKLDPKQAASALIDGMITCPARLADDVCEAASSHSHHCQATGHGFKGHEPQGLCLRGHHEDVCTGIGRGQVIALQHALHQAAGVLLQILKMLAHMRGGICGLWGVCAQSWFDRPIHKQAACCKMLNCFGALLPVK